MILPEESSTEAWQRSLAEAIALGVGMALYRVVGDVARAVADIPGEGKLDKRTMAQAVVEGVESSIDYYESHLQVDIAAAAVDAVMAEARIDHLTTAWVSAEKVMFHYAPPDAEPLDIAAPLDGLTVDGLKTLLGLLT